MRASGTVEIERPVEEVFRFLADARNQQKWQLGLREVYQSGDGQGATVTEVRAVPNGVRLEYELRVVEFEENAKISYEGESKAHDAKIARYITLRPSDSATRMTLELLVQPLPLRPEEDQQGEAVDERMLQREVNKSLLDLKDLLEWRRQD